MHSYIAVSLSVGLASFMVCITNKNKPFAFAITALVSFLPFLYIVKGTASFVSSLTASAVLGDLGKSFSLFVQEPIRLLQGQDGIEYPFVIMGFLLLLSFAAGIGQTLFSKKEPRLDFSR